MATSRVPLDIKDFIKTCIQSVSHLEVLLMLVDKSDFAWTAEDIAKELRTNNTSAAQYLKHLHDNGLLHKEGNTFKYFPSTPDLVEKVKILSALYKEMPVTIITVIFEKPQEKLKDLSDAFKIKKD